MWLCSALAELFGFATHRVAFNYSCLKMPPPLVAPIFAEGREPLPPGWTEEDRQNAMETRKWEKRMGYTMESCVGKSIMSGVIGEYLPRPVYIVLAD